MNLKHLRNLLLNTSIPILVAILVMYGPQYLQTKVNNYITFKPLPLLTRLSIQAFVRESIKEPKLSLTPQQIQSYGTHKNRKKNVPSNIF